VGENDLDVWAVFKKKIASEKFRSNDMTFNIKSQFWISKVQLKGDAKNWTTFLLYLTVNLIFENIQSHVSVFLKIRLHFECVQH